MNGNMTTEISRQGGEGCKKGPRGDTRKNSFWLKEISVSEELGDEQRRREKPPFHGERQRVRTNKKGGQRNGGKRITTLGVYRLKPKKVL